MRYLLAVPFFVCSVVAALHPASAQVEGLRSRIPTDANTVVVIDVEKLFGSPAAERERWAAKRKAAFESGVTFLSENTQGVVIAAKIDLEYGQTVWELAQVRVSEGASINTVAARFGGKIDSIEGRSSVRLPNDSYVVQVSPQSFASYTPANRQEVGRWLKATDTSSTDQSISPYLASAFNYVQKVGTPIIMAIDLAGVLSSEQIGERLAGSPLATAAGDKLPAIVSTLSGIKGVMLGVTVGQAPFGSIRVDFDGPAAPLLENGKDLLIAVLEKHGAMIDDISEWKASAEGNTLIIKGNLSTSGLRRALSVLELPPSLGHAMDTVKLETSSDPESIKRIASQQYYSSINTLLTDLKQERKDAKSLTAGGVAMWYDKYARKIDNLPLLNVDEELLAFGRDVSELLRGGENSLKAVGMRSATRQGLNEGDTSGATTYFAADSGYVGYGGYRAGYAGSYVNPYYANREKGRSDAIIRRQERTLGAANVQEMWQTIETATADIRRAMTAKYNAEF
jgi:hypothetical protein